MNTKCWGVALKKNVVRDDWDNNTHDWTLKAATVFRKFYTRAEARQFSRSWPNPTYVINMSTGKVAI